MSRETGENMTLFSEPFMGLLMMKYLVGFSYNTLIIGVHLCRMHVWTRFLVEKSQYHSASLLSFWVYFLHTQIPR